jgi:dipicolinate synthase subunit B
MTIDGIKIGFALTGSYCTYQNVFLEMEKLAAQQANLYPIFSDHSIHTDCRFGNACDFIAKATEISGHSPVTTIPEAEKLGPGNLLDILLIAPCTGNTLAKLACGITDSPVLMAAKGHLRNGKPVVLAIATNDALGANMKNIGLLMNTKFFYFVPFRQDNYQAKPYSMVSDFTLIVPALVQALQGRQLQPVLQSPQ